MLHLKYNGVRVCLGASHTFKIVCNIDWLRIQMMWLYLWTSWSETCKGWMCELLLDKITRNGSKPVRPSHCVIIYQYRYSRAPFYLISNLSHAFFISSFFFWPVHFFFRYARLLLDIIIFSCKAMYERYIFFSKFKNSIYPFDI